MDKMLAANGFNIGTIESPDFPHGTLIMKEGQVRIINGYANGKDYERIIKQDEIRTFKLIGCGASWAKYLLVFKDGKSGIITQDVLTQAEKKQRKISMSPIERYIKYVDDTAQIIVTEPGKNDDDMSQASSTEEVKEEPTVVEEAPVPAEQVKKESVKEEAKVEESKDNICPNCGAPIDETMFYCGECGRKLR